MNIYEWPYCDDRALPHRKHCSAHQRICDLEELLVLQTKRADVAEAIIAEYSKNLKSGIAAIDKALSDGEL